MSTDRLRVSYTDGPFKQDEPVLAGESFHAELISPSVYKVCNVLFGTGDLGLWDHVRVEPSADGGSPVCVEVVKHHECIRGVVTFKYHEAMLDFTRQFGCDEIAFETWATDRPVAAAYQCDHNEWKDFEDELNTHSAVAGYSVDGDFTPTRGTA